jgi:hypothetical protein
MMIEILTEGKIERVFLPPTAYPRIPSGRWDA